MAPWSWRRAVAGLGVLGLLGLTAGAAPLDDLVGSGGPSSATSQPNPQADPLPETWGSVPEPTRQPAPEMSPAAATSRAGSSHRLDLYTDSGIPRVALRAYRDAEELLGESDPSCHLHWSLLAAIGRVESDHGRHGGSALSPSGRTSSPIIGPALDGSGDTALIADSDGGRLDGDGRFDRAVGPMQFLPGTWRLAGVDGDGDGRADPSNIFDAALSAGRYLCAGDVDLSDPQALRAAVFGYNHSSSYVDLVLSIAKGYREGSTEPALPPAPGGVTPPEPLEPTPPDRDLPPATSGEPPGEPEGGPDTGDSGRKDTTPTPPGGDSTPPSDEKPEPPNDNAPPPSDEESEPPPPSNGPTGPPHDEPPSPPDDGSSPPDGGEPDVPEMSDVEPSKGPVGTEVTITGSGLEEAAVSFGETEADILEREADELVVEAPARSAAGPVTVTVRGESGESAESGEGYTYLPAIDGIEPAEGSTEGGDRVVLTGRSLDDAMVDFGGAEVQPSSSSGTELEFTTPSADEAGEVEVTASHDGQTSNEVAFDYHEPSASAEPSSGPADRSHDEVTIAAHHTEFAEEPDVTWNDDAGKGGTLEVHEWSRTELTLSLPEHPPGVVDLTVERSGAEDLSTTFTYRPDVDGMDPHPVTPGAAVTLRGSGFGGDSAVTIAGRAEDIPVEDATSGSLTFTAPEKLEPGHHELTVTTSGVPSEAYDFEVSDDG